MPGSLTVLYSLFAISLHDWKRSIGTHSISSPNLSMPITAYTLLTIMSLVEKHRGSSLSSWLIVDTLLISKFFTPFVPICSQFSLYICYLGESVKNKTHTFQCFSANDVIIKTAVTGVHDLVRAIPTSSSFPGPFPYPAPPAREGGVGKRPWERGCINFAWCFVCSLVSFENKQLHLVQSLYRAAFPEDAFNSEENGF